MYKNTLFPKHLPKEIWQSNDKLKLLKIPISFFRDIASPQNFAFHDCVVRVQKAIEYHTAPSSLLDLCSHKLDNYFGNNAYIFFIYYIYIYLVLMVICSN